MHSHLTECPLTLPSFKQTLVAEGCYFPAPFDGPRTRRHQLLQERCIEARTEIRTAVDLLLYTADVASARAFDDQPMMTTAIRMEDAHDQQIIREIRKRK